MKYFTLALVLFLLGPTDGLAAQDHAIGDWYGVLATPVGELRIIVTISRGDGGELQAELESPDQAPGQKIPVTTVSVTQDSLTFTIQPISGSFEGAWDAAEEHWSGVWIQGARFPLVLARETEN